MLREWMSETRPRTLLLGATNCALGCALGFYYGLVTPYTVLTGVMIVVTGVLLQVLCNFANDYGDAFRRADTDRRLGPIRAVMSGAIALSQLRKGMAWVTMLCAGCGFVAVALAVGNNLQVLSWFIFLGVLSILAALFYTVGLAYGYLGLGDIAVFIFFGIVALIGSQVLVTAAGDSGLDVYPDTMLLGLSVGFASVMLLHVSNTRDIEEDRLHGKLTLPARFGYRFSAVYMAVLFVLTAASSCSACIFSHQIWQTAFLACALVPLLIATINTCWHVHDSARVARQRKLTAMGVALHNVAWMVVLLVDFIAYY